MNYSTIIHANLHHVTGGASPPVAPHLPVPPIRLGLQEPEPVRQWENVGPNGMEVDGLLVFRVWRSRVLGKELVRNKVVPSRSRKEKDKSYLRPIAGLGDDPPAPSKHVPTDLS